MNSIAATTVEQARGLCVEFLSQPVRNQYVHVNPIVTMYLRKGARAIQGEIVRTLELATIAVAAPYQGNGIGTGMIRLIHEINPYPVTYIENVFNPKLITWLRANNWTEVRSEVLSFYTRK